MTPQIALAHDYLTQIGGAERVFLHLSQIFEDSPVYTALYDPNSTYSEFRHCDIRASWLQSIELFRRDPRYALPLLPSVWHKTKVSDDVDTVLVSSSGFAHAVQVPAGAQKIVYCHNPPRWIYQRREYAANVFELAAASIASPYLRKKDSKAAKSVDLYIANSTSVAKRIQCFYGIEPQIIFPPVTIDTDGHQVPVPGISPGYWLTVSRARSYKNSDVVIEAMKRVPNDQLVVVGHELDESKIPRNVKAVGRVTDAELRWLYTNARGLITVAFEDFGLTPIEANAFGTPVLALRAGGHLDTVIEGLSGWWIDSATPDSVELAIKTTSEIDSKSIQENARRFSHASFEEQLLKLINSRTTH